MQNTKVVIVDTRNQKDEFVVKGLEELGCKVVRSKLPFGDVALSSDILNCVDLKSSGGGLIELAANICSSDHGRLRREIDACGKYGGEITFLCFEEGISCVEDIIFWQVPTFKSNAYGEVFYSKKTGKRIKKSHLSKFNADEYRVERKCLHKAGDLMTKVKPESLCKAIKTMSEEGHYCCKIAFEFATKHNCGRKILEILEAKK